MQNPRKLKVRNEARRITVATYRLTSEFPSHERFGLTSQMRRAAVSIGSNISEGCGALGDRAMVAYLHHAIGSLNELEFQLDVATDLEYRGAADSAPLLSQLHTARSMIVRLAVVLKMRSKTP